MKKGLGILLLTGMMFFSVFGNGSLSDDTAGTVGVKFEQVNFAETLAKAKEKKKHILVDVFSFN